MRGRFRRGMSERRSRYWPAARSVQAWVSQPASRCRRFGVRGRRGGKPAAAGGGRCGCGGRRRGVRPGQSGARLLRPIDDQRAEVAGIPGAACPLEPETDVAHVGANRSAWRLAGKDVGALAAVNRDRLILRLNLRFAVDCNNTGEHPGHVANEQLRILPAWRERRIVGDHGDPGLGIVLHLNVAVPGNLFELDEWYCPRPAELSCTSICVPLINSTAS